MDELFLIKKKLFKVRVPLICTYTPMELELTGIDVDYDNLKGKANKDVAFKDMAVVTLSLDRIIDIYSDGYPISLINPKEVSDMYKILEDYVVDMGGQGFTLNQVIPTDDRIEDIDRFCSDIFGFNKEVVVNKFAKINNGFDLGVTLMPLGGRQQMDSEIDDNEPVGILAGYASNESGDTAIGNTYIHNRAPVIDMKRVRRRSLIEDDFDAEDIDLI